LREELKTRSGLPSRDEKHNVLGWMAVELTVLTAVHFLLLCPAGSEDPAGIEAIQTESS
jgi:hypothetical protein